MQKKFRIVIAALLILAFLLSLVNLNVGFLDLAWSDFSGSGANSDIAKFRLLRVSVMLLAGLAIPTSGFLLQEYFQNPLAGPSVLGITSVASLAVALYLFLFDSTTLPEFLNNSFMGIFSVVASVILMLVLLFLARRFRDRTFLIIFGFLISALAGAVVSILQVYADNQSLKSYVLWSFGANNSVTPNQTFILSILVITGLALSFKAIKPLIGSGLGQAYAQSFGVNLQLLKILVIVATSLLASSITAFLGPILFVGIVVPHFSRMLWNPSQLWHQWILNLLLGVSIMQLFSIISELTQIPINIITSLFGIPVILTMLFAQRKKTV